MQHCNGLNPNAVSIASARGFLSTRSPLDKDEGRRLVATLLSDGTPAALSTAAMLTKGFDCVLYAIALAPEERDAVLAALEEASTDASGELRGALMRDHGGRFPRQHPG